MFQIVGTCAQVVALGLAFDADVLGQQGLVLAIVVDDSVVADDARVVVHGVGDHDAGAVLVVHVLE